MNKKEYNQLAEKLEKQLNEKGTLIDLYLFSSIEMALRDKEFNNDKFLVKWNIKISSKILEGSIVLSSDLINDSLVSPSDFIFQQISNAIQTAIFSPSSIS